ncbi:MAG TPA: hypothetical protein VFD25_03730, partial [Clostridia bacterium]|nr:hypothetical protein [Clostridia bacterium]
MKDKTLKIIAVCLVLSLVSVAAAILPIARANDVPDIFPNVIKPSGNDNFIKIQNKNILAYRLSWLRKLNIKEDILNSASSSKLCTLQPVSKNPYTYTDTSFKREVEAYSKLYALDDNLQKTAYLYYFKKIDTMQLIARNTVLMSAKISYLKQKGVIIPADAASNKIHSLMVDALYAFMDYKLYSVATGNPESDIVIPNQTSLDKALLIYTTKLTGTNTPVTAFAKEHLNISSINSFEDSVYYTSLYALWKNNIVNTGNLSAVSRQDVYKMTAVMEANTYGVNISGSASTDNIKVAYLSAFLGSIYSVKADYNTMKSKQSENKIPLYILQLMAKEDKGYTISDSVNYTEAFNYVAQNTKRFNLDNDFYADIDEYNITLTEKRSQIYMRAIPLMTDDAASGNGFVKIFLSDGTEIPADNYEAVKLSGKAQETVSLIVKYYNSNGKLITSTTYKLNFTQGSSTGTVPPPTTISLNTTTFPFFPIPSEFIPEITGSGIIVEGSSVVQLESNILNQLYSTDTSGNYIDANGNIITSFNYETLPDGYEYTHYRDGSIGIVKVMGTAYDADESSDTANITITEENFFEKIASLADNWTTIIIIAAGVVLLCLSVALVLIIRNRKKLQQKELG